MNSLDFCGECGVSIPCNTERYCAKCQQWIDMEARILKLRHEDESDGFYEIEEEEKVIECKEPSYEDTWSTWDYQVFETLPDEEARKFIKVR